MSDRFHSTLSGAPSRWFGPCVLLLSLLAHWFTVEWAQGNLSLPSLNSSMRDKPDRVLSIALQPAVRTEQQISPLPARRQPVVPAQPAVGTKETKSAESAPISTPHALPVATSTPELASIDNAPPTNEPASLAFAQEPIQESVPDVTPDVTPVVEPPMVTSPKPNQDAPPLFERAILPPSADLFYTVRAQFSGRTVEGSGKIFWRANQEHYSISGEAGILLFTLLSYQSTGSVSEHGIAPELYTEKRFRKSATNTHFHRDRQTISFSASAATYPRKGSEQDRASIIWQLASLGRGDGAKLSPGLAFELMIAGSRSASTWRIYVNGKQTIDVGGRSTEAWHLSLLPAERSYEQQLELWLAPQMAWYPVKLLYTDLKDGHLEMLLSKIVTNTVSNAASADKKRNFSGD